MFPMTMKEVLGGDDFSEDRRRILELIRGPESFPSDEDEYVYPQYVVYTTGVCIKDLGIDCRVNFPLPFEAFRNDFYGLYWDAERAGKNKLEVLKVLSRQLAIYRSGRKHAYNVRPWFGDIRDAHRLLRDGGQDIPFLVAHTTGAILRLGVDPNIDPRIFRNRVIKYEDSVGLEKGGVSKEAIKDAWQQEAKLVGNVLVEYWDSMDGAALFMRQRSGGVYDRRFTIPGGYCDWLGDLAALRELTEEQGTPYYLVRKAVPLGTVDQVLPTKEGEAKRFLSLVWKLPLTEKDSLHHVWPENADGRGRWEEIAHEWLSYMAENGELTPITLAALELDRLNPELT